jgi:hypothetical protein
MEKNVNTSTLTHSAARPSIAQVIVAIAGIMHLLVGLAMLLAPMWFFTTIGTFPPFNRHYTGDMGAFQLALGAGLVFAARAPARQRLLIAAAAGGNLLHMLNHAYDALISRASPGYWLADTGPMLVLTLALLLVSAGLLDHDRQRTPIRSTD